ncbi:MAG TPA: hypothetical protein VKU82_14345 [Planctomycetaceae bacterium]|nr:hypothetical protein [Planctomycetaceae bacterium]
MSIHVLVLGNPDADDFRTALEFVSARAGRNAVRAAADFTDLRRMVSENWLPDLVVVCQAWPEQFSEAEFRELFALCPLARIVCLFGPWCDSDGRTNSIWPAAVRVPVAAARGRLARELDGLQSESAACLPLPLTASRSEVFEFDFDRPIESWRTAPTVEVISPDRPWRDMLQKAIVKNGGRIREHDENRADILLFDADPWDGARFSALSDTRGANAQAKVVACVGFPRRDIETELRSAGADEVWFKLSPLEELVAHCRSA